MGKVLGAFFGRPDGFGSSDVIRIDFFLCSIDLYGFREPIFINLWTCSPRKGRILRILGGKHRAALSSA